MDDIRVPKRPRPRPAMREKPVSTTMDDNKVATPAVRPVVPAPLPTKDKKKGKRSWIVALLVLLLIIVASVGVYFWQSLQNTNDETAQLRSQIDKQTKDLEKAKKDVADSNNEAKDSKKKIEMLETEKKDLETKLNAWETACDGTTPPGDCTKPHSSTQ